eukprot:scaffold18594_cov66-Cylindrotheca_fusiformis.AAC.1
MLHTAHGDLAEDGDGSNHGYNSDDGSSNGWLGDSPYDSLCQDGSRKDRLRSDTMMQDTVGLIPNPASYICPNESSGESLEVRSISLIEEEDNRSPHSSQQGLAAPRAEEIRTFVR